MNVRVKVLKRQLDEAEEENSREKIQKRKVQRDLEDQLESNDLLQRENNNLKKKLRWIAVQVYLANDAESQNFSEFYLIWNFGWPSNSQYSFQIAKILV